MIIIEHMLSHIVQIMVLRSGTIIIIIIIITIIIIIIIITIIIIIIIIIIINRAHSSPYPPCTGTLE